MRTWLKAALIASLIEALLIAPLLLWPLKPGVEEPWPVKALGWYHYISFMLAYAAGPPMVRRILGDQFQVWSCLYSKWRLQRRLYFGFCRKRRQKCQSSPLPNVVGVFNLCSRIRFYSEPVQKPESED